MEDLSYYVKSGVEVLGIAKDAAKLIVADTLGKLDEWLCDYGNND